MFYYRNQFFPPKFFNLFETSHQVHNYGTRVGNNYRPHFCYTIIKQFTSLYQVQKSVTLSVTQLLIHLVVLTLRKIY